MIVIENGRSPKRSRWLVERHRNIDGSDRQRAGRFGGGPLRRMTSRAWLVQGVLFVAESLGRRRRSTHPERQKEDAGGP